MALEWDDEELDTDVQPFGPTAEVTKRRCAAHCPACERVCGAELPPCDCSREARAVGIKVLESLMGFLLAHNIDPGAAARIVQEVARDSGVTLV